MNVIALAVASAALALAVPALAQSPQGARAPGEPGDAAARFRQVDTDGDGAISRTEWVAAGRPEGAFGRFDADGDGKLSRSELAELRRVMQARRAGGSPPDGDPGAGPRP